MYFRLVRVHIRVFYSKRAIGIHRPRYLIMSFSGTGSTSDDRICLIEECNKNVEEYFYDQLCFHEEYTDTDDKIIKIE